MPFVRPGRLVVATTTVAALLVPAPASAAPNHVWTFNTDTLGAPPPEASFVQGEVRVVPRLGGAADDRAVLAGRHQYDTAVPRDLPRCARRGPPLQPGPHPHRYRTSDHCDPRRGRQRLARSVALHAQPFEHSG